MLQRVLSVSAQLPQYGMELHPMRHMPGQKTATIQPIFLRNTNPGRSPAGMEKLNRNIGCRRRKTQVGQLHMLARSVGHAANPRRSAAALDRRGKTQLVIDRSSDGSPQSCDLVHTPSKIAGSRLRVLHGSGRRTRRHTDQSWSILRNPRRVIKKYYMSCQSYWPTILPS